MSDLPIHWRRHQPTHGPAIMRAYVGPHKVGTVQPAMTGGGYVVAVSLPGAKPVPSMFTEAQAMAEAETCIRAWFDDIPGLEIK